MSGAPLSPTLTAILGRARCFKSTGAKVSSGLLSLLVSAAKSSFPEPAFLPERDSRGSRRQASAPGYILRLPCDGRGKYLRRHAQSL